jgi:hypothetical protein
MPLHFSTVDLKEHMPYSFKDNSELHRIACGATIHHCNGRG